MSIKVSIPTNASQITLDQFVSFHSAKNEAEKIIAITGQSRRLVESFQVATIDQIINSFEIAMTTGAPKHENTFVIDGMRLGFIPDLNAMTLKEHVDLEMFSSSIWSKDSVDYTNLPKLMAILFRPVKGKLGQFYEIAEYNSETTKMHMDRILRMTLDRVNGALVFFSTIVNECAESGVDYLLTMMQTETELMSRSVLY